MRASQVAQVVKKPAANARDVRDMGLIPGLGRSSGEGHGDSVQYSRLKNPTDEPPGLQFMELQSQTQLTQVSTHAHRHDESLSEKK